MYVCGDFFMKKEKILIIVESPGKIKTIKKCLPLDKDFIVLASVGHIADLSNKYKYNLGIDIDNNFKPNYILSKDKIDILNAIINATTLSSKVLIATDADREGECIASLIKDRIQSSNKTIKRITFKAIKQKEIIEGINNQREIDTNLVDAAITRRALDRIVGYMASPFVISNLGKGVSAGRVQSVALKLVVEREFEIANFDKEEYWTIKANLGKTNKSSFVSFLDKIKVKTKEEAEKIKNELENSMFIVADVKNKPKDRNPPEPLITSTLQMLAASKYKISVSNTMEAAQALYESGHISYMRTDSKRISDEAISDISAWIKNNHPNCLPKKRNSFKNKDSAQDAHEAIRPTDINKLPASYLETNQDKIYKLIWDITVASQMTPAIYNTTSVKIVTNKGKELKANGRVLVDSGWLVITSKADIDDHDEKDNLLPVLNSGDKLQLFDNEVTIEQKFTQPPTRYKQETLIRELEKRGIGRPATYASIMAKICETRGFVSKLKDFLYPTKEGVDLVKLLDKHFSFMKYEYTSKMEDKLELIAKGQCTYLETIKEFFDEFNNELIEANIKQVNEKLNNPVLENKEEAEKKTQKSSESDENTKQSSVKISENAEIKKQIDCKNTGFFCQMCRYPMILRQSSIGYFLGCSGFPHCKHVLPCKVIDNVITPINDIKPAPENVKCPKCKDKMLISSGRYGEFYRCKAFPQCNGKLKIPYGKECPECGGELYKTIFLKPPYDGPVLCCMQYPNCNYIEKMSEESKNWMDTHTHVIKDINNNIKNIKKCTLAPGTDI
jgi:DNA topoisomerase-1